MAASNRAKNDLQRTKGKVKEAAGDLTGNERLERKGKTDQVKSSLKDAGEQVKDAGRKVKDAVEYIDKHTKAQ